MRELLPVVSDDLTWTEEKVREPAAHTRYVGLDGVWKEVDLTDDHDAELTRFIGRYMAAGRKPEAPPKPERRAAGTREKSRYKSERPHGRRTREYYDGLIAYVNERGITKRDGTGRPAYEGRDGSKDFPTWLVEEYDVYLVASNE